jgi:YD repeat-containing protein
MMRFRRKSIAIISLVILLHVTTEHLLLAITNPSYGGPIIPGRPSIVMVPGGASGSLVNTFNGNLFLPRTDLVIPGRGLPLEIALAYNSMNDDIDGPFGFGWSFSYGLRYILQSNNDVVIVWGDGRADLFDESGGTYTPVNENVFATLEQFEPNKFRATTKHGIQFLFENPVHQRLTRIQDLNSNEISLLYNPSNQLATITDASGRSILISYTNGRATTITDPNTSPERTLHYAYDALGNLIGVTDPLGNITNYAYDSGHHLTKSTDALGVTDISYTPPNITIGSISRSTPTGTLLSKRSFVFDSVTKTTTVTDVIDSTTTAATKYEYDANKRLFRTTDPLGHAATRTYDSAGNIASVTDGNRNTTSYSYDARGNVLTATDARGKTTTFTYDSTFNKIASVTDAKNHTATFTYDSTGNLRFLTDPLLHTTEYVYDSAGQLLSRRNPRGFDTTFTYDAFGNRTSVTDPLTNTTEFAYDSVGNVVRRTDAKHNATFFFWDARNRLTNVAFPDATEASFTYDAAGNQLSAVDQNTSLSLEYDADDRLVRVIDHRLSKTISYQYDGVGKRSQMLDPQGGTTTYRYDLASRLATIIRGSEQFAFEYDNGNRLKKRLLPNGAFAEYSYDAADNLLSLKNRRSDSSLISSFAYDYDDVGNRVRLGLLGGDQIDYGYDNRSQLVHEVRRGGTAHYDHRFAYDAVGNRTTFDADGAITSYSYDPADRLTQEGATTTYEYDANGNQLKKVAGGNTFASSYDVRDRLVGFTSPTTTASYGYDVLDRRITKSAGGIAMQFVYDGLDAVAEYDGSGALMAEYLHSLGIDTELAKFVGGNSFYGSERESVPGQYSCGFLQTDEFGLRGGLTLRLEQQVPQIGVPASASEQRFDVAVDGFDHAEADRRATVVEDAVEVIDQHRRELLKGRQPLPAKLREPGLQVAIHGAFVAVGPEPFKTLFE